MKMSLNDFSRMIGGDSDANNVIYSSNDQINNDVDLSVSLDMNFNEIIVSQFQRSIVFKCRDGTLRLNHVHNIDVIDTYSCRKYKITCGAFSSKTFVFYTIK